MLRLRTAAYAALIVGTIAAPAFAAPTPPPPDPALAMIPPKIAAALIANDAATLRANCAPGATVVDEFPPYSWSGPDACARWAAAFKAFAASAKMSGFKSAFSPHPFVDASGAHGYVVAKVNFTGTMAGKPVGDEGTWTFVLAKSGTAWKITSLAWGTTAHTGM